MSPKLIATAVAAVAATGLVLALSPFTTVSPGEAKTATMFGAVRDDVYTEGFHFVNPLLSFDTYETKETDIELVNVRVPSQDKFVSSVDITVKWSLDPTNLPVLRRTVGTMAEVTRKVLTNPMDSIIREAGRNVAMAQDLFRADVQNQMQNFIVQRLTEETKSYGITIHAVYIGNITLDPVIQKAIVTTKQLEEQENQEKARLEQQKLIYARQTAEAEAAAKSAEQNKIASQHRADAVLYARKQEADADLYSAQMEAKGNKELSSSVTTNLLKLRELEIKMQEAKSWKGDVPHTVMSGNDAPVRLFHMNHQGK